MFWCFKAWLCWTCRTSSLFIAVSFGSSSHRLTPRSECFHCVDWQRSNRTTARPLSLSARQHGRLQMVRTAVKYQLLIFVIIKCATHTLIYHQPELLRAGGQRGDRTEATSVPVSEFKMVDGFIFLFIMKIGVRIFPFFTFMSLLCWLIRTGCS